MLARLRRDRVVVVKMARPIMRGEPGRKRRRGLMQCGQLAQCDPNGRASEPIVGGGNKRFLAGRDRRGYTSLEGDRLRIAESVQDVLKRLMAVDVERSRIAHSISGRMRGVKVSARNPSVGNRLGCRVGPFVLEESRQHMCVGTVRALGVGSRNGL